MPKGIYIRTASHKHNLSLALRGRSLSESHKEKLKGRGAQPNSFTKGHVPHNKKDWTAIDTAIEERYPLEGASFYMEVGISKNVIYQRASKLGVPFIGKRVCTENQKQKISTALTGLKKSKEWKDKLSSALKGRAHTPERIEAIIKGVTQSRKLPRNMTAPEIKTQSILNFMFGRYNPFPFTGNRKFWIKLPSGKSRNPDFAYIERRMVIEVFGRYWHRNETQEEVIAQYRSVGWGCLVIWEDEIDINTRDNILRFAFPYEYYEELMEVNII